MLLPDRSLLSNVTIFHSVLLSMIRACCCSGSALGLSGLSFGQNKHFLYVQVPGVDIVVDYYNWMVQHPTDEYTHLKVQETHSCMLRAFFFSVQCSCIFCAWLCQACSLSWLISGITWHARLSLPHYRACLLSSREKKKGLEIGFLPWRPLASNWFAFMQPTSITRSTQAARRFLRSVRILMHSFQALMSTRTNTYVIFSYIIFVLVYIIHVMSYLYHAIYRMISVSRYPETRYWHRYIPRISHDISRILRTTPNTSSKQFRTHIWGYASLHPSWLFTAYIYSCTYLGFPTHSISSRSN